MDDRTKSRIIIIILIVLYVIPPCIWLEYKGINSALLTGIIVTIIAYSGIYICVVSYLTLRKRLIFFQAPRKSFIRLEDLAELNYYKRFKARSQISTYDATFKIVIFGDPKVGKKSLTPRYLTNLFVSDQTMAIGVDFEVKSLTVDGQKVKLQIWDFGGEERFRFLLPTYVRGARGGLFLYDITNYSSIAHIDDWLSVIRKEIRAEDIFPIIVVGNKADLVENREISSADGIKIAKSRGVNGFIECSFKTGENVEKAFEALTRLMLDKAR